MNFNTRALQPSDVSSLVSLVQQLALYEKKKMSDVKLTEEKVHSHAFGNKPYFNVEIAEINDELVGYALYFYTYAASLGAPILYLENLFVIPEHRKIGIGSSLLQKLAKIALEAGCCRMEWHVFEWNTPAIEFYYKIGAKKRGDLIQIRLEGTALNSLSCYNN